MFFSIFSVYKTFLRKASACMESFAVASVRRALLGLSSAVLTSYYLKALLYSADKRFVDHNKDHELWYIAASFFSQMQSHEGFKKNKRLENRQKSKEMLFMSSHQRYNTNFCDTFNRNYINLELFYFIMTELMRSSEVWICMNL